MHDGTRMRCGAIVSAALVAACGSLLSANVFATQIYDAGTLNFQTANQSMWGEGPAYQLNYTKCLCKTWDTSKSFGTGEYLGTGGNVTVGTDGKIGFQINASLDSGSVDSTVAMNAQAVLPDSNVGLNFFNLNPTSTVSGGQFTTSSPDFQASLDAVFGAEVSVGGSVCVTYICASGSTSAGLGSKSSPKSLQLAGINTGDNGAVTVLGQTLLSADTTTDLNVRGTNVGQITTNIPHIQTASAFNGGTMTSMGKDDLLTATANLAGLTALALDAPPPSGSLDFGIGSLSYNIIDAELGPALTVYQNFNLTPTLMVDLEFNRNVVEDLGGGKTMLTRSIIAPWDALPDIAMTSTDTIVTPTWSLAALMQNQTGLGVDLLFKFGVLSGSLDVAHVFSGSIGPLYSFNTTLATANFPPIFNKKFDLGGFNSVMGQSFEIKVPEPGSLALLGAGLLGFWFSRRRRGMG